MPTVLPQLIATLIKILFSAILFTWLMMSPLVWILRDGLGPDMVATTGTHAATKFAVQWGTPALVLAVPLIGVFWIERRFLRRTS
jgi:hypothetical protein